MVLQAEQQSQHYSTPDKFNNSQTSDKKRVGHHPRRPETHPKLSQQKNVSRKQVEWENPEDK
jgi:hypothetical protein